MTLGLAVNLVLAINAGRYTVQLNSPCTIRGWRGIDCDLESSASEFERQRGSCTWADSHDTRSRLRIDVSNAMSLLNVRGALKIAAPQLPLTEKG